MKKLVALVAAVLLSAGLVFAQGAKDLTALISAAKAEGQLTVIALPHNWVNYGEMIQKYLRQVWHQGQRAQPRRILRRGDGGDQGQ